MRENNNIVEFQITNYPIAMRCRYFKDNELMICETFPSFFDEDDANSFILEYPLNPSTVIYRIKSINDAKDRAMKFMESFSVTKAEAPLNFISIANHSMDYRTTEAHITVEKDAGGISIYIFFPMKNLMVSMESYFIPPVHMKPTIEVIPIKLSRYVNNDLIELAGTKSFASLQINI